MIQLVLDLLVPGGGEVPASPAATFSKEKRPDSSVDQSHSAIKKEANSLPLVFSHPQATRAVALSGVRVGYRFERARRRSIGFSVDSDGLTVRAPTWVPLGQVEAALHDRSAWVLRKLGESRERQARQQGACIEWRDGAAFPLLGGQVRVVLDPAHDFGAAGAVLDAENASTAVQGGHARTLRVGLPTAAAPEQIRDAVQAWLMRHARDHFQQRLNHFAPLLQVRWHKLSLSSAGTRWGSARADGAIRLNWRLVHFDPAVVDYVVAHELSHLRVMDHSPRFWDTVRSVVPDYAELRGRLRHEVIPHW